MKFRSMVLVLLILFLSFGIAFADAPSNFLEGDIAQKLNHAFASSVNIVGNKNGVTLNVSGESNLTSAALAYAVITLADHGTGVLTRQIALANGVPGQMITIVMLAYTGTFTGLYITDDGVAPGVFPMTKTGWDDICFNSALDSVTLLYVDDTIGWIIVGNNGVVIT